MGDDVCDLCYTSEVTVDQTTCCGKTIGQECGCADSHPYGECGDPSCEDCYETCDECGAGIPDVDEGHLANKHHKPSCSLYDPNQG